MTAVTAGSPAIARAAAWLRAGRGGMFLLALLVGAGAGLGAVAFRYLIYFFTWLATGHSEFGQAGYVGSSHLPWLGLGFFVVIPAIGGLLYGPLIYKWAREARGHGVPEVMIAVADNGGRIRWQVSVVKALASALCIGSGGSVGREGPIVQIGSALASSVGQWVRMPENRLRIMVACGAAGGISATFNAPITGVFFGVEIILREFAVDALFTVMLSAMVADVIAIPFLGDKPFLSGFPAGIALHHPRNYLLVAVLAVVAALMGLAFKTVLYKIEDLCDALWKGRPEWARPAVGGIALGLLLLALPQMYGVGYPVMYKTAAGEYALWFLVILAFGKILACQPVDRDRRLRRDLRPVAVHRRHLRLRLRRHRQSPLRRRGGAARAVRGGRDGRGVHLRRPRPADLAGQRGRDERRLRAHPAGHARGRDRLHRLPGAVLRHDLHHQAAAPRHRHRPAAPWRALADLKITDVMRPFRPALPVPPDGTAPAAHGGSPAGNGSAPEPDAVPGPVTYRHDPQALFASESLSQALRQLEVYGRDGLPVLSPDGQRVEGWVTGASVLRALARQITGSQADTIASAGRRRPGAPRRGGHAPAPARPAARLPGHRDHRIRGLCRRQDGSWATSAGRRPASPSPCCATAASARRTARSRWPPATGSACSSRHRRTHTRRTQTAREPPPGDSGSSSP